MILYSSELSRYSLLAIKKSLYNIIAHRGLLAITVLNIMTVAVGPTILMTCKMVRSDSIGTTFILNKRIGIPKDYCGNNNKLDIIQCGQNTAWDRCARFLQEFYHEVIDPILFIWLITVYM